MKIINIRKVGGDWFRLDKSNIKGDHLNFYLNKFNVDDYFIVKRSDIFRLVSKEDFINFKYVGYILFKKNIYSNEWIDEWIEFLYKDLNLMIKFLNIPFPPLYVKTLLKTIETL